jgi:hypothetical protein
MPRFPLAHWLAATVHVARQAMVEADREVAAGIAGQAGTTSKFSGVALYWLHGLLLMARGEEDAALQAFEKEIANETSGHLYARECCANAWYAIGALRLRQRSPSVARAAFTQAIARVSPHRRARLGLSLVEAPTTAIVAAMTTAAPSVDAALAIAAALVCVGKHSDAAHLVDNMLAAAPPGNAGWLLALEPLLQVTAHPAAWVQPLARLRTRAA